MACRHEQAIALHPAEADIGRPLGQRNEADRLAFRIEDPDPVLLVVAHPPAAPKIAVDVAAEAVRCPARLGGDEGAAVGELGAVVDHVVSADYARHHAGLDDVELGLVGRKGEPVRAVDVASDDGHPASFVEAVDVGRQLGGRDVTLVVAENAERRIGKPDRVVGLHHHVVRRVERLAVELVDQHGDGAVVFGATDAATVVLAGDQPALAVAGIAVGVVRGPAEHAYPPGLLVPAHDAVVRNVAPQQATGVAEIDRALAPAHVGRDALDACEGQAITRKANAVEFRDG